MAVEVVLADDRWEAIGLEEIAERANDVALRALSLNPADWEIGLLGCDDLRIAELNAEFRGKARPTNVLSWPAVDRSPESPGAPPAVPDPGGEPELGDIALSYETCLREASEGGIAFTDHVTHLIVHGILHLLGYDHESEADAARMETLEVEILVTLGVPNPY